MACGRGRHLRWFCSRSHPVTGVDRAPDAIESVADLVSSGQAQAVVADIENGPWPLMQGGKTRQFDAVVVTNYLWRPLFITLLDSLAPGGVLLYETFATGNETVGKPSRADFLLRPGELLQVCKDLRVVAYEDGFLGTPDRFVQRISAVRPPVGANGLPQRYSLA